MDGPGAAAAASPQDSDNQAQASRSEADNGQAAPPTAGNASQNTGPRRLTREIVCKFFAHPDVVSIELMVERCIKVVDMMRQFLLLDKSPAAFGRCWAALDAFLVGQIDIDSPSRPFNRLLRTINFCIDLYSDFVRGNLTKHRYLTARRQLLNHEKGPLFAAGRFPLPTNGFNTQNVVLQQPSGDLITVPAVVSLDPARVYAKSIREIETLFGSVVKAEQVQRDPHSLQHSRYLLTGAKVILKYYQKEKLNDPALSREDPFKEIVALQFFTGQPGFPGVIDVLEDADSFVKVETDCGSSLLDVAQKNEDMRVPENWVIHIMRQLLSALYVLHTAGFAHLDVSMENTMFNSSTGKSFLIDFGLLLRLPRHPVTGAVLPLPPRSIGPTMKIWSCSPELYNSQASIDATKVDIFAWGSVLFCLATKDKPFDTMSANDARWSRFLEGSAGAMFEEVVAENFGDGEQLSNEMKELVLRAMHPDPRRRATIPELAGLIRQHQRKFPPPAMA